MPNWCENKVVVSGSTEAMDKWREVLINENSIEPYISFDKLLPLPASEESNWYDWRTSNWGVKWDVDEGEAMPAYSSEEEYLYHFDTAWGPPLELFQNISPKFPGVTFEISYYEPGMAFAGRMYICDGAVQSHDEYNERESYTSFVYEEFGMDYSDLEEE